MKRNAQDVFYRDIFTESMVKHYITHPVDFVEEIIFHKNSKRLGGEYEISWQQAELLNSVAHHKRTTVKSGRGIGKTAVYAWLTLWFLCTRDQSLVACTAPTYRQLHDVLWTELSRWLDKSLIKDIFTATSDRVYLNEHPKTWYGTARTANSTEAMQGLHNPHFLFLIDEAPGVMDEIYNTIAPSLTQGLDNRMLIGGNPARVSGFFHDSFTKHANYWNSFTFSSEDSPLVDHDFIYDMESRYGRNHDLFKVHVSGEFPAGNPDAFISLELVEEATMREVDPSGEIQVGVDVARFGDDLTVIGHRHGYKVFPFTTKEKTSVPEVSAMVIDKVKDIRNRTGYKKPIKVAIDDTGVGGGVTDLLMLDRDNNIEVVPCNFGGAGNENYDNEGSQMWGNVKDVIKIIELPDDDNLVRELSSRRSKITSHGKIRIEPKKEYKKMFKSSPDRADALVLMFSSKKSDRLVLPNFDHLNTDMVKLPNYVSANKRYCSLFYSRDSVPSVVWGFWDGRVLQIYDELSEQLTSQTISGKILLGGPYDRIFGNSHMFNKSAEDVGSQFRKHGVYVLENSLYDESGSITILSEMVDNRKFVVSPKCPLLIDQLRRWKIDSSRSNTEKEHGLCYAVCSIVSEIKKFFKLSQPTVIRPYSGDKERLINELNKRLDATYGKGKNVGYMTI